MNQFLNALPYTGAGASMAIYRKVFRIEENARAGAPEGAGADEAGSTPQQREFMTELQELRSLIESRVPMDREAMERAQAQIVAAQAHKNEIDLVHAAVKRTKAQLGPLVADVIDGVRTARIGPELEAIVTGTDRATQLILQAAEEIEQAADTLSAAMKSGHERGLVQDIQDRVLQIFAACNFHDLTGQRVTKVTATLKLVEEQMIRMLGIWQGIGQFKPSEAGVGDRTLLSGPKLPNDPGHLTQEEIDAVFGYPA